MYDYWKYVRTWFLQAGMDLVDFLFSLHSAGLPFFLGSSLGTIASYDCFSTLFAKKSDSF